MLGTIEKLLCEKLELNPKKFKRNKAGEYAASSGSFKLRKYVAKSWSGVELTHKQREYIELDVTCDKDHVPSGEEACLLEVTVATTYVRAFLNAVNNSEAAGKFYARVKEGCPARLKLADDPNHSIMIIEIEPGEESAAAELMYSILNYTPESSQTSAQPKQRLSRDERLALQFVEGSEPASED